MPPLLPLTKPQERERFTLTHSGREGCTYGELGEVQFLKQLVVLPQRQGRPRWQGKPGESWETERPRLTVLFLAETLPPCGQ